MSDSQIPFDRVDHSGLPHMSLRMSHEMQKPKDWQAFQRKCCILFRFALNDPHAQEYGRNGQNQHGVDILGRRNGDVTKEVAIQCRLIEDSLKKAKILSDCRAALALPNQLTEIIFATTAPDDTHATDAAREVEEVLRAEGINLRVVVYGWGQLQNLIAEHPVAYSVFNPSSIASSVSQTLAPQIAEIKDMLESLLTKGIAGAASPLSTNFPRDDPPENASSEDPSLHARIDLLRDMFSKDRHPLIAERHLRDLLNEPGIEGKPWAKFRILTNLGSIALMLGRDAEAVARYVQAHDLRPEDPNARANLALALTFEGDFDQAMALARDALSGTPRSDMAVSVLLQAAAQSEWTGEPESLIPLDLLGSVHADLGLAEFIRRRELPGWQERSISIAESHPEIPEFQAIFAIAVLSLAIENPSTTPGGIGSVSAADISKAADYMLAIANEILDIGFADEHDHIAHLNNAAVLLRLCNRNDDVQKLLLRAGEIVKTQPNLRRLMALALASNHRREEAIAYLEGATDPQNRILHAELRGMDDPTKGLDLALLIDFSDLPRQQAFICFQTVASLALAAKNPEKLREAIAGVRRTAPDEILADVLELKSARLQGLPKEEFENRLRALANSQPSTIKMVSRFFLASELFEAQCAEEAYQLLKDHVDISRVSAASILYLQCVAMARRDEVFRSTLEDAGQDLRDNPVVLWTAVAHAWNVGDLDKAYQTVVRLLEVAPERAKARLFKIELMIRQDKVEELLEDLERPLENLTWEGKKDLFRLVTILAYFGFKDRAAKLGYRLLLENQDDPRAWMTFANLILREGTVSGEPIWAAPVGALDVQVDLQFDDGTSQTFIIEGDKSLRQLDRLSWEPEHALARAVMGLAIGDRFDAAGRQGTVGSLKHKFVAKLHQIMPQFEHRFPEQQGFRSISVALDQPDGLDEMKEVLKQRHDRLEEGKARYLGGQWPLAGLAAFLHVNAVSVADGLAAQGLKLKVASGLGVEITQAIRAIRTNGSGGCIMDLHSFWTAWGLKSLNAVVSIGGPIHICRGVMDRLLAMRKELETFAVEGLRQGRYEAGKIVLTETPAEAIQSKISEIDGAIAWLNSNAVIEAVVASENVPAALRGHLGISDIFDVLIVAMEKKLLLLSDDAMTRQLGRAAGYDRSCWSHILLLIARNRRIVDSDLYIRWTANLIAAGQSYIGVGANDLLRASRLDFVNGSTQGFLFSMLSDSIGGKEADAQSHVMVVLQFLQSTWRDPSTRPFRRQTSSLLLERLVRYRYSDYATMLGLILRYTVNIPELQDFLVYWLRGHFVPTEALHAAMAERAR